MNNRIKLKKTGTITLGMSLIMVGVAFMFVNFDSYEQLMFMFGFWPVILISLGAEILLNNRFSPECGICLSSILLLIIILAFAFFMAYMEVLLCYAVEYGYFPF